MNETQPRLTQAEQKNAKERLELVRRAKEVSATCIIQNVMDQARKIPKDEISALESNSDIVGLMAAIVRFSPRQVEVKGPDGKTTLASDTLPLHRGSDISKPYTERPKMKVAATAKAGSTQEMNVATNDGSGTEFWGIIGRDGDMLHAIGAGDATMPIHMNEVILSMALLYREAATEGLSAAKKVVVDKTLNLIDVAGAREDLKEPPTEEEIKAAESEIRHVSAFADGDHVITELKAKAATESDDTAKTKLNELIARLKTDPPQAIDMATAAGIMTESGMASQLEEIAKEIREIDIQKNQALTNAERLKGLGQSDLAAGEVTKIRELDEKKTQLEKTRKLFEEYKKSGEDTLEKYMTKAQRGEYSEASTKNLSEILRKGGKNEDLMTLVLEGTTYKTIDELLADEAIPEDKKELLKKLLEIGGPILYMILLAVIEEMRKQAKA